MVWKSPVATFNGVMLKITPSLHNVPLRVNALKKYVVPAVKPVTVTLVPLTALKTAYSFDGRFAPEPPVLNAAFAVYKLPFPVGDVVTFDVAFPIINISSKHEPGFVQPSMTLEPLVTDP